MAQIHALLLVSDQPLPVDEIMDRLKISRGNASMSLRMLIDWGLVSRFRRPGERRDNYTSENNPWQILAKVVRERKRKEIDPTAVALEECLAKLPTSEGSAAHKVFRQRLEGLLQIFALIDAVYEHIVKGDETLQQFANAFLQSKGAIHAKG